MISISIQPNIKQLQLSATKSDLSGQILFNCSAEVLEPSFITVVYARTSVATYIISIKQADACTVSAFANSISIADTDCSRKARVDDNPSGFALRALQLLDYAMTDLEAQAPVIVSVTPQVQLSSHSTVSVIGSPFVQGKVCSALFSNGPATTFCSVISKVEIVITLIAGLPNRPSILLAVTHNGRTFRVADRL
jgi:hypothetical protein